MPISEPTAVFSIRDDRDMEIKQAVLVGYAGDFLFRLAGSGSMAKPLRPRKLGQLPTSWGAFLAGKARAKASPYRGGGRAPAMTGGALLPHLTPRKTRFARR